MRPWVWIDLLRIWWSSSQEQRMATWSSAGRGGCITLGNTLRAAPAPSDNHPEMGKRTLHTTRKQHLGALRKTTVHVLVELNATHTPSSCTTAAALAFCCQKPVPVLLEDKGSSTQDPTMSLFSTWLFVSRTHKAQSVREEGSDLGSDLPFGTYSWTSGIQFPHLCNGRAYLGRLKMISLKPPAQSRQHSGSNIS